MKVPEEEKEVLIQWYLNYGVTHMILTAKNIACFENKVVDGKMMKECALVTKYDWKLICYFNVETGLLDQYTFNDGFNTNKFFDYKSFGKLKFPTRTEGHSGSRLNSKSTLVELKVNEKTES